MDNYWSHYNPVHIIAGRGALNQLPSLINDGKWLLVTTQGFTRRGVTEKITDLLKKSHLVVYDQVTPNPELDDLDDVRKRYKNEAIYGIIALGGGSALDTAKVLSLTIPCEFENPLNLILRRDQKHTWQKRLGVITIPTTSGTGAEVTPFATVWDRTTHKKHSIAGKQVFPDTSLLDPELTMSLPHDETLYTGLDAISHALESLWNKNKTPVSEAYAYQALILANTALPKVLEDGNNLEQREKMQQASLLAGLAISQTKTAIAHSISYPLTSHFGVPHGLACSYTLPKLIFLNINEITEDYLHKKILKNIMDFLLELNLENCIGRYVSTEEILSIKNEMILKDRADNYNLNIIDINKIII